MTKFLEAVLILSGMIIGAGMFGIPFSFARAGFWLGTIELIILTGVILLVHLIYGEVILRTQELHRLPGYVALYLGGQAKILSRLSALFGISGTLLAYVVVGSLFLNTIFKNIVPLSQDTWWAVLILIAGAAINLFSLKKEALLNGVLTAFLIGFIVVLIVILFPQVSVSNLSGWSPQNIFFPYGVLLFALSGGAIIPEVVTLLGRDRSQSRRAIILGTMLPAVLYFFFALSVVGVAGGAVSEEAISGLLPLAGSGVVILGSVIGFLAVFTSFIVLNSNFQSMFTLDFGFSTFKSWLLVSVIPAALYFLGFQNFIVIIGAVGAIGVGIDSALLIAVYHKMRKLTGGRASFFSYAWKLAVYAMVAVGAAYTLYNFYVATF